MSFPQGTLRRKIQQSSYALLNIGEEHATFTIASCAPVCTCVLVSICARHLLGWLLE